MRFHPRCYHAAVLVLLLLTYMCGAALSASVEGAVEKLRAGQVAEAVADLEAIVQAQPDDLGAAYWLGRCYLEQGEVGKAIAQFEAVTAKKPTSLESWLWLGRAQERQGNLAAAGAAYREVLRLHPGHEQAAAALRVVEEAGPPTPTDRAAFGQLRYFGIKAEGLSVPVEEVEISSNRVYDYTFTGAPSDWIPRGGQWAQTLRWTCSPQWSWYGGHSEEGVAAVWNKRVFEGDVSLEAYMAFRMGLGSYSSYKNPNDMNITLYGDGANLDSGYSFQIGAELNTVTRILKGAKVLAETRDPQFLLPIFEEGEFGTYTFHRRWWGVRAERVGTRLALYLDNKLALTAEDPEPLEAGRVALWTQDNGLVVARARISYQRELTERPPAPSVAALASGPGAPRSPLLRLACVTNPGVFADFESDLGGFSTPTADQGAALSLVPGGPGGRGRALRLVNVNAGGDAGATAYSGKLSVGPNGRGEEADSPGAQHGFVRYLSFDYKADPDLRVNVFVKVNGGWYEIVFTGLDRPSYMSQILGKVEDVKADGKWRHAEFDLWGHLRRIYGDAEQLQLTEVVFGNRNFENYLLSGFGGNHAGTTYYLDNFHLCGPGPRQVELAWQPTDKQVVPTAYRTALDDSPSTVPQGAPTTETQASFGDLKDGVHYFHVRPQLPDETWGPAQHYRLRVDAKPPVVRQVSPKGKSGGPAVEVQLADNGGVGVDPGSLSLLVNGQEYTTQTPGLRYDAVRGLATFSPAEAGVLWEDDEKVTVALAAGDFLGHALASPIKWSFTVDRQQDRQPPAAPTVVPPEADLINDDFEHDMGDWMSYGTAKGAVLSRDSTTAASGKYSLRFYNRTNGGLFGAYVRREPFDAGKYRFVSFDYKINDRVRVDFVVYANRAWRDIVFTDNNNQYPRIGTVPNVIRDNQWHHAELNLYEMLRQADPTASDYSVRNFVVADWGSSPGNTQHARWWIDNFRISPVIGASQGAHFKWQSTDFSGLLASSWIVDTEPATVPPEQPSGEGLEHTFDSPGNGLHYLHVRVRDGAGNWSPATHHAMVLDGEAPQVGEYRPQDGWVGADPRVILPLSDAGGAGVDPSSIVLEVAGKAYQVADRSGLTYDSAKERLIWDAQQAAPRPVVFEDGQEVQVALKSARDYAGNSVAALPSWSWTMDYSKDRTPPVVSTVASSSHKTWLTNTFEEDMGQWRSGSPAASASPSTRGERPAPAAGAILERDDSTAASGKYSLKITNPVRGGTFATSILRTPFRSTSYQWVSFAYKVPPEVKVDLLVTMGGQAYALQFTDDAGGAALALPGIKADDQWHTVSFNLWSVLRSQARNLAQQGRTSRSLEVDSISLLDRGRRDNAAGASFHIDNFIIGTPGARSPSLTWQATDPTGIADYSYVFDQEPGTVPDEVGEGLTRARTFRDVRGGLHFFHVRAQDGAGHWGPTAHYAVMHMAAPPTR